MGITTGIFGHKTSLNDRFITDQKKLAVLVKHWKGLGLKIVLTSGTYDLFHVGHAEYLERAKELGDLLIVGVDSDEKVRARKGPHRPVVPQEERVRILSHVRHVDVIVLKPARARPNALIRLVRPDVLVLSKSTDHKEEHIKDKKEFCGIIALLEPQAETSTSAKVRLLHVSGADAFAKKLVPKLTQLVKEKLPKESKHIAQSIADEIPHIMDITLAELAGKK
jgi:rfaE bifunctional protein nucleotidyltransferase chain/domain